MCAQCPRPRLLPANLRMVGAYLAVRTQWRHAANGMKTGLDYAGVRALLEAELPARKARRMFAAVRTIERALLDAQHEWWQAEQATLAENGHGAR